MNILMAITGLIIAVGLYLMMGRPCALLLGVALLGNGANMMTVPASGITPDSPPLIGLDKDFLEDDAADPLPQALVLTAIVIGFGMLGFAVALAANLLLRGDDDLYDDHRKPSGSRSRGTRVRT